MWLEHTIPDRSPRAPPPPPAQSFPHHRADPRLWAAVPGEKGSVTNEDDLDVLGKLEDAVSTGQSHGYEYANESSRKDVPRRKDN